MKEKKPSIICTLYNILFRLAPFADWKIKLMDKHLTQCHWCSVKSVSHQEVADIAVTLKDADMLPSLWPKLQRELVTSPASKKEPGKWAWGHGLTTAALAVLLIWMMFFFRTTQKVSDENEKVVVRSVKLQSKAAKYFIFTSDNPDKLIVWTQAKRKTNGG